MSDSRPRIEPSAAAIGLLSVLAANARYLTGLTQVLDPMIAMDPYYIEMARRPVAEIAHTDPSWGPLYALWLKPLVAMLGDPLRVYFANVGALSVAVSVAIYAYLLVLTRRAAVAAGGALWFVISVWNVPLDSKVSSFALLVVIVGLAVAEAVPAGSRRMGAAAFAVLVASYARPELYPAAPVLAAATLWLSYREARAGDHRAAWWSIAVSIATLAPAAWTGTPVSGSHDGIDRVLQALQEHFAWNWNRWHDAHASALSIWRQEFGGADGPLTAMLANPRAVARHLADNTAGTLRLIGGSAFDHFPLFAPPTWPRAVAAENVLVTAAAFGAVVAVAARPERRRALRERYGMALFQFAVLAAVCTMATAIVFPVPRYLMIPCVLVLLTAVLATSLLVRTARRFAAGTRVAIALACFAAVPRPFVVPSTYAVAGHPFAGRIAVSRRVADTVAFVRTLQLPLPVRVLSTTDGIAALLGDGFEGIDVWGMGAHPLDEYMRAHDVGVVINLEGGRQSLAVDDPTWARLQLRPEEMGFTAVPVPGHETVGVFVRNDLVARIGAGRHGEPLR